ncbi:hypothetical protein VNO77_46839 [Canavalia gladiata]|uniref:Uncharacterized protein n=1 Tax=Canavalia gladiata TaxID=3824 RepID=A0AAN9JFV2_CANGL
MDLMSFSTLGWESLSPCEKISSVVFLRLGEAVRICYSCLCLNRSRVDDVLFHPIFLFVLTGNCLAFKALFLFSLVRGPLAIKD